MRDLRRRSFSSLRATSEALSVSISSSSAVASSAFFMSMLYIFMASSSDIPLSMYGFSLAFRSSDIFSTSCSIGSPLELSRLYKETIACALAGRSTKANCSSSSCFKRLGTIVLLDCTTPNREGRKFTRLNLSPDIIVIDFESYNPAFTVTLDAKGFTYLFGYRHGVDNRPNLIPCMHLLTDTNMLQKAIDSLNECVRFYYVT